MSTILDRIKKRRCYPVEIAGGTVYVRALTRGELERVNKLPDELKTDFMIGCVLVEESGESVIPRNDGESDEEFCRRVAGHTADTDSETVSTILGAVSKIGKTPPAETLAGN